MAKKQTFSDKLNKENRSKDTIKLIRSSISKETGSVRFSEEMLKIPNGKSPESHIKEISQLK